jgi:hypothetical protein
MTDAAAQPKPFRLEFANRVIEHLGVKLYQNKPTNVVAEFLSNSWDADSSEVDIELFADADGHPSIAITDNGRGMTRDELTDEFLVIGRNRRSSPTERSDGGRALMGRKGIGKLAGFGIAKTVDVIASPNPRLRGTESARAIYWLRFSLQDLLARAESGEVGSYEPDVVADGMGEADFQELVAASPDRKLFDQFFGHLASGAGGVAVILSNTTLQRAMNPDAVLQSMGRRFTVSMLRPDFVVRVNGKGVTPELALPPLHPFGFGDWSNPIEEQVDVGGSYRPVQYWVKFVDIESSNWSIENAGIGIYAHGKIAQDRPFFFDVKGKEILSRYVYGVIEADWLDELPADVVSTDRRSIDWDVAETAAFHKWGSAKLSSWLEEYRKWRSGQPKRKIVERIRAVSPRSTLTGAEEEALAELLSEVLPGLADDEDAKNRATQSFTEAWTHAPTRALTQALWQKVFSSLGSDRAVFAELVENLRKSMVPEAMGLAVTVAQRIAAITTMRRMIEENKTETHLQRLIETFPWLLGPRWERLTANQTIRTLVARTHKPDHDAGEWDLDNPGTNLKPDFVFLSDAGEREEFVVFELKGPEAGKTLQPIEYEQLSQYLKIIRNVHPDKKIAVRGVLVGHDSGGFEATDTRIEIRLWSEILLEARALHVEYLRALLLASEPNATDARLRQIADFGGKETMELLTRLQPVGNFPDVINDMLQLLGSSQGAAATLPDVSPD